jgi:hypothetical protein
MHRASRTVSRVGTLKGLARKAVVSGAILVATATPFKSANVERQYTAADIARLSAVTDTFTEAEQLSRILKPLGKKDNVYTDPQYLFKVLEIAGEAAGDLHLPVQATLTHLLGESELQEPNPSFIKANNLAGLERNGRAMEFKDLEAFKRSYVKTMRRKPISGRNLNEFVDTLKDAGYFTDSRRHYYRVMRGTLNKLRPLGRGFDSYYLRSSNFNIAH